MEMSRRRAARRGARTRSVADWFLLPSPAMRGTPAARRRVAFYSHDTMGLGHMRRNLLLAETLARNGAGTDVLVIAGSREAAIFGARRGIDCVTLPALQKRSAGAYAARHLDVPLGDVVALRSRTIAAAIDAFNPDLFVVDNVPRGAEGELNATLGALRRRGRGRAVLGLRDVLDAPATVRAEWGRARNEEAIRRYYDEVWVYGDRAVYDLPHEYGLAPDVARMLRYTGYIDQRPRLAGGEAAVADTIPLDPFVLCTVGGGQDGAALAHAFADAVVPPGMRRVIVTGPQMDPAHRQTLVSRGLSDPALQVFEFLPEPMPLVARAACVVAMGGYNTVCEILSLGKPAVIVPRVTPRSEQLIRAQRLAARGLVGLLHPGQLCAATLSHLITHALAGPRAAVGVDLNGLERVASFADELMDTPEPRAAAADAARAARHVAC